MGGGGAGCLPCGMPSAYHTASWGVGQVASCPACAMRHAAEHLYRCNPPQADLADRDFTAERGQAVVIISSGAVDPIEQERNEKERREAEERHRHRLKLPRRPSWTSDMTGEELDLQVRLLWC